MDLRNEVLNMKKEVKEIKNYSIVGELISDLKKMNKRLFIIWIITFISFLGLLGYTIYLLNDISEVNTTEVGMAQELGVSESTISYQWKKVRHKILKVI